MAGLLRCITGCLVQVSSLPHQARRPIRLEDDRAAGHPGFSLGEFVILDGIEGQGHYVGTFLSWLQGAAGWWGEGEVKFFMDGDRDYPTICGTGTEDYFGGAWSIGETYSTPYLGYPYHGQDSAGIPTHCLYRWHVMDPIRFKTDLRVTIQTLGLDPGGKFQPLAEDIASVAYWYQTEPHKKYTSLMLS